MTVEDILRRYGFYMTGAGVGGADVLGQGAVQAAMRDIQAAGLPMPQFLDAAGHAQIRDPRGPGNGEGGSDWANIARLATIVGGAGLATGGFSGLSSGAGTGAFTSTTANPSTWLPSAIDPSGSVPWMENLLNNGTYTADPSWGGNPLGGGDVSFQNPDGSWGSTAANSGAGGQGAYAGYTGADLSFLPAAWSPMSGATDFLKSGGLSTIASGLGLATGLKGLFGGNGSGGGSGGGGGGPGGGGGYPTTGALDTVSGPNAAAYQRLQGIDPSAYIAAGNAAGGQYGDLAALAREFQGLMQSQAGNALTAQNTLQGRGNELFDSGRGMQEAGRGIIDQGAPLIQAGNAVWNTAQDPQDALRNRTQQRLVDASRSATSARGIGSSGEAAGIENQAVGNFAIDWENNQLARMLSGLSGMGGAYNNATNQYSAGTNVYNAGTNAYGAGTQAYGQAGQYGQLYGADLAGAMGYGAMAPGYTLASGQVPYQTQQSAYGAPLDYSNMYSTAMNTALNPNLANYNLAQNRMQQQSSASGMNALMTGLGGLNTQFNQPGSWLSTAFNGYGAAPAGGGAPNANAGYAPAAYSAPGSYNPFPTNFAGGYV